MKHIPEAISRKADLAGAGLAILLGAVGVGFQAACIVSLLLNLAYRIWLLCVLNEVFTGSVKPE